jgi:hypothetical protein
VLAEFDGRRAPVLVDAAALDGGSFAFEELRRLRVGSGAGRRQLDLSGARGWVRRLAPPAWRPATRAGSQEAAVRASLMSLVVALASQPSVRWLTAYPRLVTAENKLRQGAHAAALGIRVPHTAVVSNPTDIPAELGEELVVKPLGPGHFTAEDGEERVVWAQAMRRDDPRLTALGGAPFLLQQRIVARRHLRVVTCGGQAFSCQLDAAGLPLDWRADVAAHHSFTAAREPQLEARALALAADLGLGYSSQDWLDDGAAEPAFIDLNPAGQWLFLPEPVSSQVSAAIAAHLAGA